MAGGSVFRRLRCPVIVAVEALERGRMEYSVNVPVSPVANTLHNFRQAT
ncbi:hypothetical protein ARTHRO9AX_20184 [Arthrobacter sp. 9AX]|nr:hypothetical protein ARTHRO9AX_20184 [Arthrobacter sp. 9AX]